MEELIGEFLTETNESLGELDNALVQLEQNPNDKDLLSKIFRVMHTIKGTSGFLNLPRLGRVAHKGEDLLGLFRDGKLLPDPGSITLVLEALDRIKSILVELEQQGREPEGDDTALIARLEAACVLDTDAAALAAPQTGNDPAETEMPDIFAVEPAAPLSAVATETPPAPSQPAAAPPESAIASQSLRVNVDVLEDLMTLVSELVLTRNQILQVARNQKDSEFTGPLQRLNHIVSDLQDGVMKTRMQPVGNAWSKLPRIVRDISRDLGKKIDVVTKGETTELDRQVLEMIKDPLTHMVRNSADHGIETPAERLAAGKGEAGTITLNSYHEGGHIIIEIKDDGRGLPVEKIRKKILQNGLASEAQLADMTSQQIQQFIFHAGFSTADQVTSVSGRGVGMDVVRSNIEKIGGSIEMTSIEGKGTSFVIKIPLTLAIVSALIVGVDGERFAIPQLDVRELVMISPGGANRIETINGAPVFRLRDRILPLIGLRSLLGFPPQLDFGPRYIAVVHVGACRFGIVVNHVYDTEEIVVKPVSSLLSRQDIFSGNTILGDGQVIMILDSAGILKASGLSSKAVQDTLDHDAIGAADEKSLLLFDTGRGLKAVPLDHVARLEEIDLADIELAGGNRVVQYCGTLMPIMLSAPGDTLPGQGRRPVIVFSTSTGMAGLVVEKILDITSFRGEYHMRQEGSLAGSAIIQGRTTDIINLGGAERAAPMPAAPAASLPAAFEIKEAEYA